MSEQGFGFERGSGAAARVAADPFWRELRRRHPDVDVVLLPPEPPPAAVPADAPVVTAEQVLAAQRAEVDELWGELLDAAPATDDSRWTHGGPRGTARHEVRRTSEPLDEVRGLGLVDRAARLLEGAGWSVLQPEVGMARVSAGRPDGLDLADVLVLHDASQARLVVRWRTGSQLLDAADLDTVLGRGSRA